VAGGDNDNFEGRSRSQGNVSEGQLGRSIAAVTGDGMGLQKKLGELENDDW
jgi:hypothetical protein